ncbi:MAG TPA: outer membrane protein assembly factor BamE [Geminicoccaceae bacterium]|jgi:outer membrane protein assembly factor BamE (lipoprotein component of BamABCDE complex)|nr:outer membrane protein assembly factor BamE [Geminicoccaceae bacterium]
MARTGCTAALAALMLVSCTPEITTHGYRFDEASLHQLEPGRTTQDGVTQLLGSPSAVATFSPRVWYYISQRSEHKSFYQDQVVDQKVIEITFDDKGVLQNVDQRNLADARTVALVDRETPTSGNELSVLQQFLGNIGRFNPPGAQEPTTPGNPNGR